LKCSIFTHSVRFSVLDQDIKKYNVTWTPHFTIESVTALFSRVTLIGGESFPLTAWQLTYVACNWFTGKKFTIKMSDSHDPL
jgi:hypothetical protein